MAWLPMYLDKEDLKILSKYLNDEENIALIEPNGKGCWKAVENFNINKSGRYCIYRVDAGTLPLLPENKDDPVEEISDPFKGWQEKLSGIPSDQPYFGSGHTAIFWLDVHLKEDNCIGISSFSWIGNHYSLIGRVAPDVSKKWWGRLGRWVRKNSTKISRSDEFNSKKREICAFEVALKEINSGVSRASNP